jgi:dsRNA-specific ribonuclease
LGIPRHQITCTFDQIGSERIVGFACKVWVRERCVGEGEAASRRLAKRLAMEVALERLQGGGWKEHI